MDGLLAWDKPQGGRIVGFSESGDPNDIHWLGEQPTGTIWVTPSAGGVVQPQTNPPSSGAFACPRRYAIEDDHRVGASRPRQGVL